MTDKPLPLKSRRALVTGGAKRIGRAVAISLALVGRTGADDPNQILLRFRIDHDDQPTPHRTDRDEPILVL